MRTKILLASILLIAVLLFTLFVLREKPSNEFAQIHAGRKAFNLNCVGCHDSNGDNKLQEMNIASLERVLFNKITDSVHLMFVALIDSKDKKAIIEYIKYEQKNIAIP